MSQAYFLVHSTAANGALPTPSERWVQAFAEGRWVTWSHLLALVRPGDTVWMPVSQPQWPARIAELLVQRPGCLVVVLSSVPEDAEGLRALDAGARGYCHLQAVPELLREVEQVVVHGGLWVGPSLVQRLVAATRELVQRHPGSGSGAGCDLSALSEREAQVARAVALGKSNKEVAEQLYISERTVKAHLGAIFDKLGVRDRVQLVLRLQSSLPADSPGVRP